MDQNHKKGKINKNSKRVQIPVKKKVTRNLVERFVYNIFGGKRAPWLENKVSPPRSKNPILRFFGF